MLEWLGDPNAQHAGSDTSALTLQSTIKVDHILPTPHSFQWKFSVSEASSVGIAP